MTVYAVGDIQGCYPALMEALEAVSFNPQHDQLWCVGDLVNRGPDSVAVLDWLYTHQSSVRCVLGNHDVHLLCQHYKVQPAYPGDTLEAVLVDARCQDWCDWLRQQPLIYEDPSLNAVMVHAGIWPLWTLDAAKQHASEFKQALQGPGYLELLKHVYGHEPTFWEDHLAGWDRLRFIVNAFTRMRYCTGSGALDLSCKVAPKDASKTLVPWFDHSYRQEISRTLYFGHWASLQGYTGRPDIIGLDSGCVWGGKLTLVKV